eukprot:30067-Pelagococcus_subviridis.AAC.3
MLQQQLRAQRRREARAPDALEGERHLRALPHGESERRSIRANIGVELKGVRSGLERRRGRGMKPRDPGRRETPGKVLKDRRPPRQRGRMGTSQCIERT